MFQYLSIVFSNFTGTELQGTPLKKLENRLAKAISQLNLLGHDAWHHLTASISDSFDTGLSWVRSPGDSRFRDLDTVWIWRIS